MKEGKGKEKTYVTAADFRSVAMPHGSGDHFNPPGLTNFWGCLQAARDVMGIQHLTFPPYSQGDVVIGMLTLNDVCFFASGISVTHHWRPDAIDREAEADGFRVRTRTVMGVGQRTVTIRLRVANKKSRRRDVRLRVRTGDGVICSKTGWKTPYSPKEKPAISVTPWEGDPPAERNCRNRAQVLGDDTGILYSSQTSRAFSFQAFSEKPTRIDRSWLDFEFSLGGGEERTLYFFVGIGPEADELRKLYDVWRGDPEGSMGRVEEDWNRELAAVFTPGNDRYSGHLPRLVTRNAALKTVYLNAVSTAVYFKRTSPDSAYGRTFSTLMPRYWVTTSVMNDWSLSGWILCMLDPETVRRQVELWLERDIYKHFGTEYVSGTNSGNWYSCNDYAMTRLISCIVRLTGDFGWLKKPVAGRTILEHVKGMALYYEKLDRGHGLGDYGERNSLLECVGSYLHEVASLNASAVWGLREAAMLCEHAGEEATAADFRGRAAALVPKIQELYVKGGGYWNCRQPDGSLVPTRHLWDFIHTANFLHRDLPKSQLREMAAYFERELWTPTWAHALSPLDEDVDFSLRPDHEWNGSYPAWVGLAMGALVNCGREDLLKKWLPGLAKSAKQGPYSQSHFVESYAPPESNGGALKAPTEWPYINDWTCLAAGAFFESIVSTMFGVDFGLKKLTARPRLSSIDPRAVLEGVPHQGKHYAVTARGAVPLR